ncbi:flagella basal body P-ring formation protein FlgA [Saccharophagus sp. K07]|jgi:flagella basal body P-ring formation protein FlgA|uniref:flagellar basal body P-ring formation chaperone FlgA n=1 Tax=Saccharophagus sp. K07 TaxID=2283636 RepID=UPI00165268E9|nr:flagellar basal body P-ring formation chaperone FlgA [Saccharophagus sp. K07]MBC6907395.1 flagella basal body P-ring formation protein FlgA [Saccharophagus sp. K07]
MGYRIFFFCWALLCAAVTYADSFEDPNELRAQVNAFLLDTLQNEYVGIPPENLEVNASNLDPRLRLSKCLNPLRYEITSPRPYGSNLSVKVNCSGPSPWTIYVPARVDVFAEIVVLARSLERGTVLTQDDVTLMRMNLAQAGFGNIRDTNQVVGMELKRRLEAGEPVRLSHVKQPQVVRKGDRVVLEASTGAVSVVTSATALASGQVGEQIQVRNEKSKRIVDAEIVGPGKVKVHL